MIDQRAAVEFLDLPRLAVVGASDAKDSFGGNVYRALKAHGTTVVPVHRESETVDGDRCWSDIALVPTDLDGVIVMVGPEAAVNVVRAAIDRGVPRIWLFRGIGGPGAVSDEAIRLCEDAGVEVIAGACPFMFLGNVGLLHRLHRRVRRAKGAVGVPVGGAGAG